MLYFYDLRKLGSLESNQARFTLAPFDREPPPERAAKERRGLRRGEAGEERLPPARAEGPLSPPAPRGAPAPAAIGPRPPPVPAPDWPRSAAARGRGGLRRAKASGRRSPIAANGLLPPRAARRAPPEPSAARAGSGGCRSASATGAEAQGSVRALGRRVPCRFPRVRKSRRVSKPLPLLKGTGKNDAKRRTRQQIHGGNGILLGGSRVSHSQPLQARYGEMLKGVPPVTLMLSVHLNSLSAVTP